MPLDRLQGRPLRLERGPGAEVRRTLGKEAPPLVIVTLDPWRDTPSRLASIADEWQLDEGSQVLSGEVNRVELVLSAWQVPRSRNTVTGELIHPALAYVVSPEGKITHLGMAVSRPPCWPWRSLGPGSL